MLFADLINAWSIATVPSQGDHSCIPIRAVVWPNGRAGTK
jgi:hypothetical protein